MEKARESLIENSEYKPVLKRITVFAGGGAVIDGYILTIIGIALLQITPDLNMDVNWSGIIGSSALLGILIGGLFFGYITDLFGRRLMYTIDLVAMVLFSVAQMFISSPLELAACRFLIGIAIGADYPIANAMLTEFTPKKYRGFMTGSLVSVWYVGAILASIVGYVLLILGPHNWRWMLGSSAILALIMLMGRWDTPESPRWLMSKGRTEEARRIVKNIWGEEADLEDLEEICNVKTDVGKIFQGVYLKRLIFVSVFWTCQVIPCFTLYTFGPQILSALNMGEGNKWIWGYMILNIFFFIGCIPALKWVESVGRRPLLIRSYVFMALSLLVLGIVSNAPATVVIICFAAYAFASGGPTVLDGVYPSELFPTDIRASAYGVATAVSRLGAAIGTYLLPLSIQKLGIETTMIIATVITSFGLIVSIAWAPETRGKTLKETSSVV
ncbi:MAG: MFS transporter [Bacillota bacterium]|nr:MFS transporter [Bacillota bacterium]